MYGMCQHANAPTRDRCCRGRLRERLPFPQGEIERLRRPLAEVELVPELPGVIGGLHFPVLFMLVACTVNIRLEPSAGLLLHLLHVHLALSLVAALVEQPPICRIVHHCLLHHGLQFEHLVLHVEADNVLRGSRVVGCEHFRHLLVEVTLRQLQLIVGFDDFSYGLWEGAAIVSRGGVLGSAGARHSARQPRTMAKASSPGMGGGGGT